MKFLDKIATGAFFKITDMKSELERMKADNRGQSTNIIGAIILLAIAAIFIATLFLEALQILGGANTSNITGATLVLFGLISIVLVLGILILILKAVGIKIV